MRVFALRGAGPFAGMLCALLCCARPGLADSKHDIRLAEALFDEGKAAMERGDLSSACAKLEESRRLDPAGGTELALAVCYERARRFASAWRAYRQALASAQRDGRADRQAIARARLGTIEPRLSRITIEIAPELAGLPGLSVRLDELELRRPSWGIPIPYDGGNYTLRVTASGHRPLTQTIVVHAEHESRTVRVSRLEPAQSPPLASGPVPRARAAEARRSRSASRTWSYALGGAGAAALLAGGYFGARAISAKGELEAACDGTECPRSTEPRREAAIADAQRSTVLLGVGLIAVGIGIYLFLDGAEAAGPNVHAGGGPNGLKVRF